MSYNSHMINSELIAKFKERYPNLHPLLFLRSLERAKTPGDAFDILEGFPNKWPVIWDEEQHCWSHTADMLQSAKFNKKLL